MPQQIPLKSSFFARPTLDVARDLLGCRLVRCLPDGRQVSGLIVETEAYIGENDRACHAAKGRTPRTEVMFGPPGRAYIYLIYGMYHCLNFVTERSGFPAAVLIRGLAEPTGFDDVLAGLSATKSRKFLSGPGRLCREFGITRELNGVSLTTASGLYVTGGSARPIEVIQTPRIGVDYAGEDALLPWRFVAEGLKP